MRAYRCTVRAFAPKRGPFDGAWRCGRKWVGLSCHEFIVLPATTQSGPEYDAAIQEGCIEEWRYRVLLTDKNMLEVIEETRDPIEISPVVRREVVSIFEELANEPVCHIN